MSTEQQKTFPSLCMRCVSIRNAYMLSGYCINGETCDNCGIRTDLALTSVIKKPEHSWPTEVVEAAIQRRDAARERAKSGIDEAAINRVALLQTYHEQQISLTQATIALQASRQLLVQNCQHEMSTSFTDPSSGYSYLHCTFCSKRLF